MNINRIKPGPNQESVWDYPRPPRIEDVPKHLRVVFNGLTIADTEQAKRVLETSHPPVYYIPPNDIAMEYLIPTNRRSWCEWKGLAAYYSIKVDRREVADAAWYYPHPTKRFESIQNYVAFYPSLMDACYVDDELVQSQVGGFYGGWVTRNIVGPFKGEPGTRMW